MANPDKQQSKPKSATPPAPAEPPKAAAPPKVPVALRWLTSKRVRQLTAMRKHVQKMLNHQRDILAPPAVAAVRGAVANAQRAVAAGADPEALDKQMESLESAANKWLKPYPNAAWRENVEVLLVALTVAMGIRTFFLQPFKIPTGSMQPTLYGVTSENLINRPDVKIPMGLTRVRQWFEGVSYVHKVAANDGLLQSVSPPVRFLIFNILQTLVVGGTTYTIWLPPDYGAPPGGTLEARAGLQPGFQSFTKGEDMIRLRVNAGDHLFVDRLTYNFRPPKRGEIVVFETKGIDNLPPDQFYIKRLVGLGGETLSLKQDYTVTGAPSFGTVPVGHLVVYGHPLSAATPHFENVYSFTGAGRGSNVLHYREGGYYGHAMVGRLATGESFQVAPNHLFVMGDNTMNSLDSRYWGDFPANQVIGKSFFVYWPLTDRFGWGNQ
ncbi:MAG TPA: signal peptidase I [Candidatus Acidoferrum sp.]|nr:signal peptidase I [Candidatus Acidoferrum sp.]